MCSILASTEISCFIHLPFHESQYKRQTWKIFSLEILMLEDFVKKEIIQLRKDKCPLLPYEAVVCSRSETSSKKVIFVNIPAELGYFEGKLKENIDNFVKSVLDLAESKQLETVAMSALGADMQSIPQVDVAEKSTEAISGYFSNNKVSFVKHVRFVVKDPKVARVYKKFVSFV